MHYKLKIYIPPLSQGAQKLTIAYELKSFVPFPSNKMYSILINYV